MSFQAYLDNIKAKTGKSADEFVAMARAKGLGKPADVVAWLKADYGLGHGHAMAIVAVIKGSAQPKTGDDRVKAYFSGAKARWVDTFEQLVRQARAAGPETEISPASSYLSLVRKGRKFAIVQASGERLDVGIKLKGEPAQGRFEDAGSWNAMVTHRVRVSDPGQVDAELLDWIARAYERA